MKLAKDPSSPASTAAEPKRTALARRLRGEETATEPAAAERAVERYSAVAQRLRADRNATQESNQEPARPYLEQPPSRSGVHALRVDEALIEQKKKKSAG